MGSYWDVSVFPYVFCTGSLDYFFRKIGPPSDEDSSNHESNY